MNDDSIITWNWIKNLINSKNWCNVYALTLFLLNQILRQVEISWRKSTGMTHLISLDANNAVYGHLWNICGLLTRKYQPFQVATCVRNSSLLMLVSNLIQYMIRRWSWMRKSWKTLWPNWVIDLERAWHESNFLFILIAHSILCCSLQHIFHFQYFFRNVVCCLQFCWEIFFKFFFSRMKHDFLQCLSYLSENGVGIFSQITLLVLCFFWDHEKNLRISLVSGRRRRANKSFILAFPDFVEFHIENHPEISFSPINSFVLFVVTQVMREIVDSIVKCLL